MRLGIVSEYARPWPGGISEHVAHEARELRARGHTVWIITGPSERSAEPDDSRTRRLRFEVRFSSNGARSRLSLDARMLGLRRLFRQLDLDTLHVHAPLEPVLGWAAVLASQVPTVGTFHASFPPGILWDALYQRLRAISGRVARRLDVRVAVSSEARRSIARYFPGDYEIVPNGVDCGRFQPGIAPLPELAGAGPVVLFAGRPDARKGLPVLLEAFARLRARGAGARLVLVGIQERDLGSTYPLEGVTCAGQAAPDLMPGYFASATVVCAPSTGHESQGVVLLEAMASGRAVVASDLPGYRTVLEPGRNGVLVPPGDAQALAESLAGLLRDDARRQRLACAGRETALTYDWSRVASRLEACFERARQRHAAR